MPADANLRPERAISRLIHAQDPYLDLDVTAYKDDLQGWGGHQEFWDEMVKESKAVRALEVGTWKGRSAIAIADAMRRNFSEIYEGRYDSDECNECGWSPIEREHAMSGCTGPSPELVCLDTWLGATEFLENHDDVTRYKSLGFVNGYPTVYYQFLANVRRRNFHHWITPFPQTSTNGMRFFARKHVRFDLIYIDGSHDYDDVASDIRYAWPLLKDGGILVGDDYCDHWDGVMSAVDLFVDDEGLTLEHRQYPGEKYPSDYWIVRKP